MDMQGGSGYARDVVFEDITVLNVEKFQYYCDSPSPCGNQVKLILSILFKFRMNILNLF